MKNIHILPTDKLSIIGYDSNKNLHFTNMFIDDYQNIYITSDEEIKDGNKLLILRDGLLWGKKGEVCTFIKRQPSNYGFDKAVVLSSSNIKYVAECDIEYAIDRGDVIKIILTTDQDLIKNGIQPIDDEFLKWFVKNPSCEFVNFEKLRRKFIDILGGIAGYVDNYKIIIPKEEPKQETLEEYISEVTKNIKDEMSIKFVSGGIKLGAKWQAERIYSKDGVLPNEKTQAIDEIREKMQRLGIDKSEL